MQSKGPDTTSCPGPGSRGLLSSAKQVRCRTGRSPATLPTSLHFLFYTLSFLFPSLQPPPPLSLFVSAVTRFAACRPSLKLPPCCAWRCRVSCMPSLRPRPFHPLFLPFSSAHAHVPSTWTTPRASGQRTRCVWTTAGGAFVFLSGDAVDGFFCLARRPGGPLSPKLTAPAVPVPAPAPALAPAPAFLFLLTADDDRTNTPTGRGQDDHDRQVRPLLAAPRLEGGHGVRGHLPRRGVRPAQAERYEASGKQRRGRGQGQRRAGAGRFRSVTAINQSIERRSIDRAPIAAVRAVLCGSGLKRFVRGWVHGKGEHGGFFVRP